MMNSICLNSILNFLYYSFLSPLYLTLLVPLPSSLSQRIDDGIQMYLGLYLCSISRNKDKVLRHRLLQGKHGIAGVYRCLHRNKCYSLEVL